MKTQNTTAFKQAQTNKCLLLSFFGALNRINQQDYIPTETDVLRSRVKTTGIVEMDVVFDNVSVKCVKQPTQPTAIVTFIIC